MGDFSEEPGPWQEAIAEHALRIVKGRMTDAQKNNLPYCVIPERYKSTALEAWTQAGWSLQIVTLNERGDEDPNGDTKEYRLLNPHHEE